ncbi:hypothetical protein ACYJW8_14390 [Frateuria aurantia]
MRFKTLTIAVAVSLGLCAFSAQAQSSDDSSSNSHRHAKSSEAAELQAMKAQIAALQAQLANLEQRTQAQADSQEQLRQANVAQVAAAQAQVDAQRAEINKLKDRKLDLSHMHYKGLTFTFGGYLEAATINRQHATGADISQPWNGIPYPNATNYHMNEFRQSEHQSRFSMLVQGDPSDTVHLAGYYEMDFQGAATNSNTNESNSFTPRTRNVYMTVDWDTPGLHFLAGQNWSLLTMNKHGITPRDEWSPQEIDAQYSVGYNWTRQSQLRIVKDWDKKFWLGLSLENPETTFGGTTALSGATVTLPNVSGYTSAITNMPDVIIKGAMDPGFGHYEAFGIARGFTSRYGSNNHETYGSGFGGSFQLPLFNKHVDLMGSAMKGRGIGRYGSGALPDATLTPDGRLSAIKETTFLTGLTYHVTKTLDLFAYYGQEREGKDAYTVNGTAYGYGNPLYVNSGCMTEGSPLACIANTERLTEASAGGWWSFYSGRFGKAMFGVNYAHITRQAFAGVGGSPETSDNMIWTSFRYYPF